MRAGYSELSVLHGIDLRVAPGGVVAVLGPNGAGKSTQLLASVLRAEGGTIRGASATSSRGDRSTLVPEAASVWSPPAVAASQASPPGRTCGSTHVVATRSTMRWNCSPDSNNCWIVVPGGCRAASNRCSPSPWC